MTKQKKVCSFFKTLLIIIGVISFVFLCFMKGKIAMYKANADIPADFTYTAHTGCCKTKDNTLECIDTGVKCGAGIVEFDLRFDKNQNPVLSHDAPVGGEVTLDEAFAKISTIEDLKVNVDVKTCVALQKVQELAIKHNVEQRIFFTGINESDVKGVNEQYPTVQYYLNMSVKKPSAHTDEYLQSLVDKVKECGAVGINFNYKSASRKLVEYFHKNGLLVSIFTVDKKMDMYRILSYGPDNITTRNPDIFQNVLKEF